jgi:hypothetical protein
MKKSKLLDAFLQGDRDFFKEIKKIKGKCNVSTSNVNGYTDNNDIAQLFASEYCELFNACEYDQEFIANVTSTINYKLNDCERYITDTFITKNDIQTALKRIKANKSDGVFDLVSNHFINAPDILFEYIAKLFTMCLVHGYVPSYLLISTILPIPKDNLGDLSSTNNYRAIALCALLFKIYEYVILIKHNDSFTSPDHQFAYKQKSSTTQCTWVAKEVISYYKRNKSNVFSCLLDCSKAFDMVRFDILFNKLIERDISPIIIRLLFHSYIHSKVRVRWNESLSPSFNVCNGVRQGAVLSPLLFNIYMEELIEMLCQNGDGCWVGNTFYGSIIYADDIMLLSPTVTGLKCMIKTCETFGISNGLKFNPKKTVCINFHNDGVAHDCMHVPEIKLNNCNLKWAKSVKHLGHVLSCCLNFASDVNVKKGKFIACVNYILSEFPFANMNVKCKMLSIYGTSFYGSNLWNLYNIETKALFTAWNVAIRRLCNIHPHTHTKYLDEISGLKHLKFSLKVRFISFVKTLLQSNNQLIQNLIPYSILNVCAPTGEMISRILNEYEAGSVSSFILNFESVCDIMKEKYTDVHGLTEVEKLNCQIIKELIDHFDGLMDINLNRDQCLDLMYHVATN